MSRTRKGFWTFIDRVEGDKVVWIIVLMLIMISIVCMFSSTSRLLKENVTRVDILVRHLEFVCIGIALIITCYNIRSIKFYRSLSKWGFIVSAVLLIMLSLHCDFGVVKAKNINGAWRILQVGNFQIHVFEVVKVAMVMYFAWAMDALKKGEFRLTSDKMWQRILYIYFPFVFVLLTVLAGSNSSGLFIGGLMFVTILLGGGDFREMMLIAAMGVTVILLCFGVYKISGGKYMARIGTGISRVFENEDWEKQFEKAEPGSKEYKDAIDNLRQPVGAKIAVKEGGLIGKGPGQSTQRYKVPDVSEDYIYSFIIEEYGLVGGIFVLCLYLSLMARGAIIARNCGNDLYAKLTVAGLTLLISGQAFLHIFVNADIGPMTGQTLPMVSHGNSAFLCFSLAFGIILSFSRIASRRIQRETENAEPIVDESGPSSVQDDLNDLDDFESNTE